VSKLGYRGWVNDRKVEMGSPGERLHDPDAEIPQPSAPVASFTDPLVEARFEYEAAVLDLSEAGQTAARAGTLADRGDVVESQRLAELARQLYDSADRHQERAHRLDPERRFLQG